MILHRIENWLWRCELVLAYAAMLATAAMMGLTSVDALGRYLLNSPITGAYEVTEKYLMVAAVFLGLSYAYRGGAFIRVTFLVERLPAAPKMVADYFAHIVSLAFCLFFVIGTGQLAFSTVFDATTLSALPIPVGPAYGLVPLGFAVLTALMLVELPRVHKGESLLFAPLTPAA